MSERPPVSVIVPFAGGARELAASQQALATLKRRPDDQLIIADNRPWPPLVPDHPEVEVVSALGPATPGFARNVGARGATGEWLVFIDADTRPTTLLLDDYFDPPPADRTAVLAGGISDIAPEATVVARYLVARAHMNEATTLRRAGRPYAQSANCAIRSSAFHGAGGFEEQIRAGEDADLCFRLQQTGWELEERPHARVDHISRASGRQWLLQLLRHGSGAGWLARRWIDEFLPPQPPELAARLGHDLRAAAVAAAQQRREDALFSLLDAAGACAFEVGRLLPNRPPGWRRSDPPFRPQAPGNHPATRSTAPSARGFTR